MCCDFATNSAPHHSYSRWNTVVATNSADFPLASVRSQGFTRDLVELVFGFVLIMAVLWVPEHIQVVLGPLALAATLSIVLARCHSLNDLGLGWKGLLRSSWILPAAVALALVGVGSAREAGSLHELSRPNLSHVYGYILWTLYQQFLLQDYFMPRLLRLLPGEQAAIAVTAILFAAAHLPNLVLVFATVVWGGISCALFLRYRNFYMLGIAQGILGLCLAVCVPNAFIHHMRVGLGFLHYHAIQSAAHLH